MRISGIYKITNILTNDFYVGSAVYIKSRWARHKCDLRKNKHANSYMQNAWNKYGEINFYFEIIEQCIRDLLTDREQFYIDTLQPKYNLLRFAHSNKGYSPSQETRDKLSKIFKGRVPSNKGVKRNPETIELLKEAWKRKKERGYRATDETREKLSKSLKGLKRSEAYKESRRGIKMSPEAIKKGALARTGRKASDLARANMSAAQIGKMKGENNPMFGKSGELSPNFGKICKEKTKHLISIKNKQRHAEKQLILRNTITNEIKVIGDVAKEYGWCKNYISQMVRGLVNNKTEYVLNNSFCAMANK